MAERSGKHKRETNYSNHTSARCRATATGFSSPIQFNSIERSKDKTKMRASRLEDKLYSSNQGSEVVIRTSELTGATHGRRQRRGWL